MVWNRKGLKRGRNKYVIQTIIVLFPPPTKTFNQRMGRLLRKRTSLIAVNNVQNYTLTSHFRKRTVSFYFATESMISIHQRYGFLKYLLKLLRCFITRPDCKIWCHKKSIIKYSHDPRFSQIESDWVTAVCWCMECKQYTILLMPVK